MSLILDALKKTDSSKETAESNSLPDKTEAAGLFQPQTSNPFAVLKQNKKTQIIFVAVLATLLFAVVIYFGFGSSKKNNAGFKPDIVKLTNTKNPVKKQSVFTKLKNNISHDNDDSTKENTEEIGLIKQAITFFNQAKFKESADIYKHLVNKEPSDAEMRNNYGVALKKAGRLNDAKLEYQTAVALKPDYAEALNNLAVIELNEHDYNEAKRHLEKALELNSQYIDAHLHLALCFEKLGDVEAAVEHYQLFLDLSETKVSRQIRLQVENRLNRLNEDFNI